VQPHILAGKKLTKHWYHLNPLKSIYQELLQLMHVCIAVREL